MVWYQLRFKYKFGKKFYSSGLSFKNLDDARKDAHHVLSVNEIQGNRVEIWAVRNGYSSEPHIDDRFVEAIVKRPKSGYKKPKTNAFGLDLNLR